MSFLNYQVIKNIIRVIIALFLGTFVLNICAIVIMLQPGLALSEKPWLAPFVIHSVMLALSFLLIIIISRGTISGYGFRSSSFFKPLQLTMIGLAIGILMTATEKLVPALSAGTTPEFSLLQTIIFVWIYASIAEEVLTRGLIQGYLQPLQTYGLKIRNLKLSVPVLVSALFFGLMHLAVLTEGQEMASTLNTVFFAFILGLFAGYYREKSGSLMPAIMIHIFGNIGGTLAGFILRP